MDSDASPNIKLKPLIIKTSLFDLRIKEIFFCNAYITQYTYCQKLDFEASP